MSKEYLQKRMSILVQYSNKWRLELNLCKTKIMILLTKKEHLQRTFKFYFQGKEIDVLKQYTSSGLINTTTKPVALYACKSWGDPRYQNDSSKIENFHSHSVNKY